MLYNKVTYNYKCKSSNLQYNISDGLRLVNWLEKYKWLCCLFFINHLLVGILIEQAMYTTARASKVSVE